MFAYLQGLTILDPCRHWRRRPLLMIPTSSCQLLPTFFHGLQRMPHHMGPTDFLLLISPCLLHLTFLALPPTSYISPPVYSHSVDPLLVQPLSMVHPPQVSQTICKNQTSTISTPTAPYGALRYPLPPTANGAKEREAEGEDVQT